MTVYLDTAFAAQRLRQLSPAALGSISGGRAAAARTVFAGGGARRTLRGGVLRAALAFLRTAGMKAVLLAVMALTAFGARRQTVKLALLFAAISAALAGAAMLAAQLLRLDPLLLPSGVFYPLRARAILFLAALCCGLCHLIFSRVTAHSGSSSRSRSASARAPACALSRSRPCSTPATP